MCIKPFNKQLLIILITAALIISTASIEAVVNIKSKDFYEVYLKINRTAEFKEFINYMLMIYIAEISLPVVISVYIFFTIQKYGINNIAKLVFGGMIFTKLGNIIVKLQFNSFFYYAFIILYTVFFISIIKKYRQDKDGIKGYVKVTQL
ncbi:hypothetical protein [Treponema pedis]|uniref:Uncharacterized protein n=1 Tax=Treponema pedis str. T A4 TaxID=1291379 RepID=S6A4Y6_9SPIR|nr:hypothetical protein [Treponema pedis]AGT44926.1 hypothetical protein TPE_2452 [Treponema pedis str. T A4]